ncbi:hypothetical protein HY251_20585 [bacterium]|nr:hypothetical protein [bacterium]
MPAAALRVTQGYLKGRVLMVPADRPFVLGASLEADLTLFGTGVLEQHATFEPLEGGGHRLVPAEGATVVIDGETVPEEGQELQDGDVLEVGRHLLEYAPLVGQSDISVSSEFLPEDGPEAPISAEARCSSCGDTLGPDADAISLGQEKASLRALRLSSGLICPRCVDRRLQTTRDLGEFKVVRKTNTNEHEVTYLAIEAATEQRVALRILKAERCGEEALVRRFLARALVGLGLGHPNFVEVLSVSATKGITFVVMEHFEQGQKLERLMRDRTPIAAGRAILLGNQLAEIQRFARERGIVVGKRKKTGILVDRRGWVKVLSFDVTPEVEEQIAASPSFQELAHGGTRGPYTAPRPEPASLRRLPPERAEILGLARILFQLLSGRDYDTRIVMPCIARALARDEGLPLAPPPPRDKKARFQMEPTLEHVPKLAVKTLARLLASPEDPLALTSLLEITRATKNCFIELQNPGSGGYALPKD